MRWKLPKPFFYASVAATTVAVSYLTKDYMGGTKYTGKESLVNKVVIVTGANTGIGRETVLELAKRDAKVIMACRDMKKCEKARQEIVLETKNKYVYCRKCDLASQESIRKFVKQFKNEYDKLHILINNAGVMRCPKSYTKEGIEMQLGVNYIGHFLLTNLLLDVLKTSAPSRIVNVSSASYYRGKINMTDLNSDKEYDAGNAYTQSKLALIFFTRELANKLRGTGVTVNAVHPGIVDTSITRHMFVYNNFFTRIFLKPFAWPFIRAPLQGAQTVLYAALDPSLTDVSGCYFDNCEMKEVAEEAKNDNLAKWLWKVSEKWTQLDVQLRNRSLTMPLIGATMQWESADKSIGKIVLKPAVYTKKATEHSKCNVLVDKLDVKGASNKDLIEKYHTDILDSEGEKVLVIGEASAEIDRKIENAIQMMNIHERSLVTITMPAIQSEINSESIIVKFQITLIKCERNKPIWELNAEEKYEIALKYKERGIELFKDSRIIDAFYKFSRACKILITLEPIPDLELDKQLESNINNLRLMLYNNMAMCHLNRKNYEHTITLCTKILDKDKNNVKALYRRGVAYGNMKNNEKAVADIKEVLTLEPNNNAAKEKFNIYNDRLQESVQRSNDMIKRMFKTY